MTLNLGNSSWIVNSFHLIFEIEQTEVVMLSMKMSKYNKYNWVQERNLVVTQDYIYVFKHKSKSKFRVLIVLELNRLVQISSLQGITKSLHVNSREVVLHF